MIIALICLGIYIMNIFAFCAWDAFIGLPVDFDGYNNPPLWLVAIVWPIAVPILSVISFNNFLQSVKEKRIEKAELKRKTRIKLQKEEAALLRQIEKELEDEREDSYRSRSI